MKLFLDVDGVLNIRDPIVPVLRLKDDLGVDILVPEAAPRIVQELSRTYEVVWSTAWFDRAPKVFGPILGVGSDWPVLQWTEHKLLTIETEVVAPDERYAIVDDDVYWEADQLEMLFSMRQLAIEPHPTVGINQVHLNRLLEFARREV